MKRIEAMEKAKGVIFDLDGTLWDSSAEVAAAWSRTLKKFSGVKQNISTEEMRGLMGKTMTDIFRILAPNVGEELQAKIGNACCQEEERSLRRSGGTLFPHEAETLTALSRRYRLFIVSNCQSGYIETFLNFSGFGKLFSDFECFGGTGKRKWENIVLLYRRSGLKKAVYVGDTRLDFESARRADILFLHAAYGYGSVPEASYEVGSFEELADAISKVLK